MESSRKLTGVFIAIFASLFLVVYNFAVTNMAAIYIVGDLGGSNDTGSYTISIYALGNALGVPFGRALYERVGTLRLFLWSMLLFALFSELCSLATTWPLFLTFRFIQGFVSGPIYIVTNRMLIALGSPQKKELFTILFLSMFTMTPAIGASIGGWIAYDLDWRWNFHFIFPIQLMIALYLGVKLKGFDSNLKKVPFDLVGYIFFFLGVFNLSLALIIGQEFDWFRSNLVTTMVIVGALSLLFFILWDLNHPYPILAIYLMRRPIFTFGLLNLAILFSAYFGTLMLLALWLGLYVNYTPIWLGVLVSTMALGSLSYIFLATKRLGKRDTRISLVLGILLLAISSFHTTTFNEQVNFERIILSRVVAGCGFALFLPPIFRLCFNTFTDELGPKLIGMFQLVRSLASGLGASIYTTLWQRRQVFYHDRLGSQLTIYSPETKQFFIDAEHFNITGPRADAQLEEVLQRRATALALDDCFWLMAWICVGLIVITGFTLLKDKKYFTPETIPPDPCPVLEEHRIDPLR